MRRILPFLFFFLPLSTYAHSFGQLYSLPVPFWLYLYGAGAAMLASFLIIGYFFDKKSAGVTYSKIDLSKFSFTRFLTSRGFSLTLKTISVLLFLFTILTGLLGEDSAYSNFNMTFFWIFFVLGLTYLTALVGDIYSVLNPWKILTDWLVGKENKPLMSYPRILGYFPALVFYFVFIWLELVGQTTPFKLSVILLIYTIINDLGVVAFGREIWFKYCEFLSVFFRLISRIAPLEYRSGRLYLRPPFVGLVTEVAESWGLILFTLFMLSSTAFDGFKETLPYSRMYWGFADKILQPVFGTSSYAVFATLGLLLSPFIFLLIYLIFIYLAKLIAKSSMGLKELALQFTFSLVPIALVYNLAHYYTLIFTQGPSILRLLSDPFGHGSNFFGTADNFYSIILPVNFIWHSEVALILVGHIVAVYLTHLVALQIFPAGKRAWLSQFPMLVLMILYTLIGLWILSQPLTSGV